MLSLEALLKKYGFILERRCQRILCDESWVEDAMQEILLAMHRSMDKYRGDPDKILSWLYRITTTHCLRILQKRRRWDETIASWLEEQPFRGMHTISLEDKLLLEQLIESLEEEDRSIVLYRYVDGMTQDEITKVMEITRDRVRHRLQKFKKQGLLLFKEV